MDFLQALGRGVALAGVGVLINVAVVPAGMAQGLNPPEFTLRDPNFVDLVSFSLNFDLTDVAIGTPDHPLAHTLYSGPLPDTLLGVGFFRDNSYALLNITPHNGDNCPNRYVIYGNQTEYFKCVQSTAVPSLGGTGSTLLGGTYTRRDGSRIIFGPITVNSVAVAAQRIEYPDGRILTYGYCASGPTAGWICSLTRNDGMQLKYIYSTLGGATVVGGVVAINNAYEYCDPTAPTCTLTNPWPQVNYTWGGTGAATILTVTDPTGLQTRYTQDSRGRTIGIKLPTSASADNLTYSYCDDSTNWCSGFHSPYDDGYKNYVKSVVRDGQTWTYSGSPGAGSPSNGTCGFGTYSVTNPVGAVQTLTENYCFTASNGTRQGSNPGTTPFIKLQTIDGTVVSSTITPLTTPISDSGGRIRNVTKPEGNQVNYTWDARGNLTQVVMIPKSGSPLPQVASSADYSTSCTTSPVTCNKPNWTRDGLNNQIDYRYDTVHGGMLTKTLPADVNGIRPQTRYTYIQRSAWVKNSSGTYVQSAPIWVLATESFCRTSGVGASGTGCTKAGDEVVKTYDYGPDSGPNNLFVRGIAITADGATLRTCYGYDPYGHKISETQPRAGLASCP